jgi:amino acid transporter
MVTSMSRFTQYALIACSGLLVLYLVAAMGVQAKRYALDPLHFFDRDSSRVCMNLIQDVVLLTAIVAAATGLFSDLRRMHKAGRIRTLWFVALLLPLVWISGSLILWFTVGRRLRVRRRLNRGFSFEAALITAWFKFAQIDLRAQPKYDQTFA